MTQQTTPFKAQSPANTRGNATIYVLIVVVLFAALGFVLTRQSDTSESGHLSDNKADIIAGQILAYPPQVKQAMDMMVMSGTDPSDIDYTQPGQSGFNTAPTIKKIFHPDGGGLSLAPIPSQAIAQSTTNPPAGWYLSLFNNVEWSKTTTNDVVLVAYQISQDICKRINLKLTGSATIPVLGDSIPDLLIAKESPPGVIVHSGSNVDFTKADCTACDGKPSLCVGDTSGTRYGFYSIIINR